jgi:hypothetical protein
MIKIEQTVDVAGKDYLAAMFPAVPHGEDSLQEKLARFSA